MFVLLLFTFGLGLLVFKKYFETKAYADFYSIRGPKTLPLIGNALLFIASAKDIYELQIRLAKEYEGFYRLIIGSEKILVLCKPEHVEVVLRSMTHSKKSKNYDIFRNFFGNGLVNSSGTHWQTHRKIITPTFHFKTLQSYSSVMCTNLKIMMEILANQKSEVVNISHFLKLCTLDAICESAMRCNIDAQLNADSGYVKALKGYFTIHMQRFFSLFLRNPIIFKLSQLERKQCVHINYMKSFTDVAIASRKTERREKTATHSQLRNELGEKVYSSFLDHLLDHQDSDRFFTDQDVRDEVNTFMFAGHDTVSSCISFCIYELSGHPEVQQRLVEESWDVMGKGRDVEVNVVDISALKYLDLVVKECMRLHTIVPFIERELGEDTVINGKLIPKGMTIQLSIHAIHHNAKYYPQPNVFDPERFSPENVVGRHPYAYIPFSAGPRNCVGFKYAALMTKAAVINILRNFVIKRPIDDVFKPEVYNNAVIDSLNGINIILEKRL